MNQFVDGLLGRLLGGGASHPVDLGAHLGALHRDRLVERFGLLQQHPENRQPVVLVVQVGRAEQVELAPHARAEIAGADDDRNGRCRLTKDFQGPGTARIRQVQVGDDDVWNASGRGQTNQALRQRIGEYDVEPVGQLVAEGQCVGGVVFEHQNAHYLLRRATAKGQGIGFISYFVGAVKCVRASGTAAQPTPEPSLSAAVTVKPALRRAVVMLDACLASRVSITKSTMASLTEP